MKSTNVTLALIIMVCVLMLNDCAILSPAAPVNLAPIAFWLTGLVCAAIALTDNIFGGKN